MVAHEYFEELISLYALGSLPEAERVQMQAHLAECAACRERYRQERAIVQMLPRSLDAVEPSRETKQKLFARVDADLAHAHTNARVVKRAAVPAPRRNWFARPAFAFAVAALLFLAGVGGWLWLQNRVTPEQQAIAAIMNDPKVQQVALAGTPDAPNAWGRVYMVPGHSQAVLKVGGMQPLPQDMGYEFWFIRGQEPHASNVFTVNADGTMTVLVKANAAVENFNAWGVTIEPKQGVPSPTGKLVILGGG